METKVTNEEALTLAIQTIINNRNQQTKAVADFFSRTDTDYQNAVAPERNKAVYLLGHIIATNDGLLSLLGFGDRLFPELDHYFATGTQWEYDNFPTIEEWREKWTLLNETLSHHISATLPLQWLERHTKVTAEDFELDPSRNKLNVLIGRTLHMRYHLGQLNLIKF